MKSKFEIGGFCFSYKPISLYLGKKKIDKEISKKNLLDLKVTLDKASCPFCLAYGTLLGAVREHDFISHDEDIDLSILEENKIAFFRCLPNLLEQGFAIARYDMRGFISIIRENEYIDIYFFKKVTNGIRGCCGNYILENFLLNTSDIEFQGASFKAPVDYVDFLEIEYGDNWQVPIEYVASDARIWYSRFIFQIKDSLPICLKKIVWKQREKVHYKLFKEKLHKLNIKY